MDTYQLTYNFKMKSFVLHHLKTMQTRTLLYCWWGSQMVPLLWKSVRRFPKTLKIEFPQDPAIPLLGVDQKGLESGPRRYIYYPIYIAALCTIDELWKQVEYPTTDEWICVWNIQKMEYYFALKSGNPAISDNVDEPGEHYDK